MDPFWADGAPIFADCADTAGQDLLRQPALAFAKLASGQVWALSNIGPAGGKALHRGK
jgi:hypothetical protein